MKTKTKTKRTWNGRKKHAGIYLIELNNSCYIGQSVDIFNRWNTHLTQLFSEKHHNKYLLELFINNNYRDITFRILKLCSNKQLDNLEKEFITKYIDEGKNVLNVLLNKGSVKDE